MKKQENSYWKLKKPIVKKIKILYFFYILTSFISINAQDSLLLEKNADSWKIDPEYIYAIHKNTFNKDSLKLYNYLSIKDSSIAYSPEKTKFSIYRIFIKNHTSENLETGFSTNCSQNFFIFTTNENDSLSKAKTINIRGRNIYGRKYLSKNKSISFYLVCKNDELNKNSFLTDYTISIYNFNSLLNQELTSRFIHSLLLGLLLFSAILNLILGLILQRRSHVILSFYLMSLLIFAFSYLGFYDEFFASSKIHIPISLPVYFLTLILFLQVSKSYLHLEKNLPGWNTITNVIMFFLILSIPYYYLTVYIETLYNNFLAFSSLFFFSTAALLGLIESIMLLKKEPKAKYFLIANLTVVISLSINIFLENRYPVVVGSVIQGFIFTIGLAEEIKILDRQKLQIQHSLISQLEVNLKFKEDLNLELEKKVNERTHELKHTNKELTEKNNIVEQQKELLEIRSREIKDSIEYAKRIQTASFPSIKILEKISKNYFIFYRPRDIVSGDFYWFGEVDEKIIIIASDCTGHGIPGAFMSMYGIAFLNEIINKEKIYKPNEILNTLRERIAGSLNRGDDEFETMDGMDMSVLTIDKQNSKVLFAGAFNPLYLIRDEKLQIINADKMPVAFYQRMDPFTLHQLELKKGDSYYIFTDGIIDQFGGEHGKKYLTKRLKMVIDEIKHLPMAEQKNQIEQVFSEWKGNYFQVDDILMIGLNI